MSAIISAAEYGERRRDRLSEQVRADFDRESRHGVYREELDEKTLDDIDHQMIARGLYLDSVHHSTTGLYGIYDRITNHALWDLLLREWHGDVGVVDYEELGAGDA